MTREVKDFLKTLKVADSYSIGTIDGSKYKTLGIYSNNSIPRVEAFGRNSSYKIASIKLLLHWNKNAVETEIAARNIWDKLRNLTDFNMGEIFVFYLDLKYGEPVFVGPDDIGIYEYVIDFDIYYKE